MRVGDFPIPLAYRKRYRDDEPVAYSVIYETDPFRTDTLSNPDRSKEWHMRDMVVILRVQERKVSSFVGFAMTIFPVQTTPTSRAFPPKKWYKVGLNSIMSKDMHRVPLSEAVRLLRYAKHRTELWRQARAYIDRMLKLAVSVGVKAEYSVPKVWPAELRRAMLLEEL